MAQDYWKITFTSAGTIVDKNYDPYANSSAGLSDTASSAYQKNLQQTVEMPKAETTRDVMGRLYNLSKYDKESAQQGFQLLLQLQQDKTSRFYNPYTQATNQAVSNLAQYGIDTSNIDDNWFNANGWLKNYWDTTANTNGVKSPGKKASTEEKAAYQFYQIQMAEEQTKKAEQEWQALQEELNYWVGRTDRNYSDDEIIDKIDWSKYKTLQKMDETKAAGTPMELNRAVGYSQDNLYGVLWAARNGGSTGNVYGDLMNSAIGSGNKWVPNSEIAAKLDAGDLTTYSPYSVGSTLEEEGLYFGMSSFDAQWLEANRKKYLGSGDETVKKMYGKVMQAEQRTQKAEDELKILNEQVDKWLERGYSEDKIMQKLDTLYDDLPTLKAMDDSLLSADLLGLTRAVDYRRVDVENKIHETCLAKSEQPTGLEAVQTTVQNATTSVQPTVTAAPQETAMPTVMPTPAPRTTTTPAPMKSVQDIQSEAMDLLTKTYTPSPAASVSTPTPTPAPAATPAATAGGQTSKTMDAVTGVLNTPAPMQTPAPEPTPTPAPMQTPAPAATQAPEINATQNALRDAYDTKYGVGAYDRDIEAATLAVQQPATLAKSDQEIKVAKVKDQKLANATDMLETDATPAEMAQIDNAPTVTWDDMKKLWEDLKKGVSSGDTSFSEEFLLSQKQTSDEAFNKTAFDTLGVINAYEKTQQRYEVMSNRRGELQQQVGDLVLVGKSVPDDPELVIGINGYDVTLELTKDLATGGYVLEGAINNNTGEFFNPAVNQGSAFYDRFGGKDNFEKTVSESIARMNEYANRVNSVNEIRSELTLEEQQLVQSLWTMNAELDQMEGYLNDNKSVYQENREKYDDAYKAWNMTNSLLFDLGVDVDGGLEQQSMITFATQFYDEPKQEKYGFSVANVLDESYSMTVHDANGKTKIDNEATQLAEEQKTAIQEEIADIDFALEYFGGQLSDTLRANMEKQKALLENSLKDYEYYLMGNNDDWDEMVALGKQKNSRVLAPDQLMSESYLYWGNMTAQERDRYHYLLGRDGEQAAREYYDYLANSDYAILPKRFTDDMKQAIANSIEDDWVALNLMAIGTAPVSGIMSGLGLLYSALSGKALSEDDPLMFFNTFANSVNQETSGMIRNKLGEDTIAGKIALGAYEIAYNRGRSLMNILAFPGLGAWGEFAGAAPMATSAMADAVAKAKDAGAEDWQAWLLGGVTFLCEAGTEMIEIGHIKSAKELGLNSLAGIKEFLKQYPLAGLSEALGESLNDIIENAADRIVMMDESEYEKNVWSYMTQMGLSREDAEAMVDRDQMKQVLHTAIISFLSPGLDVFSYAAGKTSLYLDYYQQTRAEQQMGSNVSIRDIRNRAQSEARTALAAEEAAASREPGAIQVPKTEPVQVRPSAETVAKQLNDYVTEMEILESTRGMDTAARTSAVAAVLDPGISEVATDRAKAAAVRIGEVLPGGVADIQDIMAGGLVSEQNINTVKMGLQYAALGGSDSESLRVVQSATWKNVAPDKKAAMLATAAVQDAANTVVQKNVAEAVRNNRVAEVEKKLIAEGAMDSVMAKQQAAEAARVAVRSAETELSDRQKEQEAASEALAAANRNLLEDAGNPDLVNAVTHAVTELENRVKVTGEYEQQLANAQERRDAADAAAKTAIDDALTDVREQAKQIIDQEDAARAEVEAVRQAEMQAEAEAGLQAQIEEDEKNGKAEEVRDDAMIDSLLDQMHLEGEERETQKAALMDRRDQIKLGKVDTTGMVNNAEGYLALSAFSRKLGLKFELSDNLGNARGMYRDGTVYLNSNLVQNGNMTVGQALVEASLHEIVHSAENTKNYQTYKRVVLDSLFQGDQLSYEAAIDQKIADYKDKMGVDLTPEDAEKEIVADFARTHLNEKDVIDRLIDNGLGGRMRNTLHNINQAIKNFRLTGEERQTAEYLRRAERSLQKALDEVARSEIHPEGGQFSVAQIAQATGLQFDPDTLELYDVDSSGNRTVITDVTPDMINDTPVGLLIDQGLSGDQAAQAKEMMAGLMSMVAKYKDSNLIWEIGASTLSSTFSALKSNSDPQYKTTVDFGTVCAKTQAIVDVMSQVMLDKIDPETGMLKEGAKRGLTRDEIMKVYNEVHKAGLSVPCPVCYVFSRWMGVPSLLGQMSQYQHDYVVTKDDGSIDVEATQKKVNKYLKEAEKKYGSKEEIDKLKNKLTAKRAKLDKQRENATTAAEADDLLKQMVEVDKQLGEVSAYNWVTQALCAQDKNGKFVVDPKFEITPDAILFDLNRTGEFAKYEKNWRYRNTRGAGMGKSIMPYSGETIGDIINGVKKNGRWTNDKNPYLLMDPKKANNALRYARERARKQNLVGGQRLQSTSDFRPEWGLDYIMSFLELQAAGSKVQMYTKVAEAVDFFASVGADVNLSIMGKGSGYHEATAAEIAQAESDPRLKARMGELGGKTYVLDFSNITGMDYDTAVDLKNTYDNVQMILVGMNDEHIRLAIANPDIDFVIPWHSSGNSRDVLSGLISSVGEKLKTSHNYEDTQTDTVSPDQTPEQKARWDARMKIIMGQQMTADERNLIYHDKYLSQLYDRFYKRGVDPDCYGVRLSKEQASQIFPYEYWDTTSTKDNADVNGQRFVEYCESMGIVPRFNQFANDPGYWKLLIDRPMYNNDGSYHQQQVIDVTNAQIGSLDENGQLIDSSLPTQAQAKYAPKDPRSANYQQYTEAEKTAIENAKAAVYEQYDAHGQYSLYGDVTTADMDQMLYQAGIDYQDAMDRGDTAAAQDDLDFLRENDPDAALDAEYMYAVNRGDMETAQRLVNERAEAMKAEVFAATDVPAYRVRRDYQPKKTIKVYKTFTLDEQGRPSALFVSSKNALPVGVWLDAQDTFHFTNTKNGRMYVPSTKNPNTKGGATGTPINLSDLSKSDLAQLESLGHIKRGENGEYTAKTLTSLAYRPGWHAGDMPFFPQGGMKIEGSNYENVHRYNQVVFECEMAADEDYTSYDIREDGTIAYHDRQEMPVNGSYKFATNPMANAQDIGAWYISGALKINRALTEAECNQILAENGRAPQEWQQYQDPNEMKAIKGKEGKYEYEHTVGPLDLDALGYDPTQTDGGKKLLDPVTYDDEGNIIPLSQRFDRSKQDPRYSSGGELTPADMDQMLMDAGVIDSDIIPPSNLPGQSNGSEEGPGRRQFGTKTAQESSALHDEVKEYLYTHSNYTPDTNAAQIDRSIDWVQQQAAERDPDGYYAAVSAVESPDFDYRSADGQARMLTVMGMAVLRGDVATELRIADAYNKQGTDLGRALQARKLFRMMTPLGRVSMLQKEVDRINEDYGKAGSNRRVALSEWTLQAAAAAETEEDFDKVRRHAAGELAEQMPANWKEKLTGWRMLSMLGNPRTHIRNILGNAMFMPVVGIKNKVGAVGEILSPQVKTGDRTKTLGFASPEARAFAKQDAQAIKETLTGEAKYSDGGLIEQERKAFGQGNGHVSKTLGKALQAVSDFNGNALEWEDWVFLNRHYRNAMAGYMTANKLTADDMTGETLEKARAYAVQEAQKATYRDANELASTLSKLGRKGGATGFVVNAVLPFKKTPANILRRGVEYSPVSILKGLSTDAYHLKQYMDYQNGELEALPAKAISPAQWLDRMASGLTGTGIMALGALLASTGFVTAGFGDDDDDEFEKLKGKQEYSLNLTIGGQDASITLDWAAPVCMPFFVGATVYDTAEKMANGEEVDVTKLAESLLNMTEPVFNLSMLDGVNSLLDVSQSAQGNAITKIGEKVLTNYATSFVPTLFGQVARTIDTTRRKAYVESGAGLSTPRYAWEQVENKIPFLSQSNIPYRNAWGEDSTKDTLAAGLENFFSPAYINQVNETELDTELQRLFDVSGNKGMIPKLPNKTITAAGETIRLNAEQYDQLTVDRGTTAKAALNELIQTPEYQMADDATKVDMVSDVWTYANQTANSRISDQAKKDKWVVAAEKDGTVIESVIDRAVERNKDDYVTGHKKSMMTALDEGDLDTALTSLQALRDAGVEDKTLKTNVTSYFKPIYLQADEAGDWKTTDEIEMLLEELDLGYDQKTYKTWLKNAGKEEDEDEESDRVIDNTKWLNR